MSFSQPAQPYLPPAGNLFSTGIGPSGVHQVMSKPVNTTRILLLSGFAPELKTRDLLAVFSEWEDQAGGYRIKWIDDQSAYIVFQDPSIAKKAFLATISNPPPALSASMTNPPAKLVPYSGEETDSVISSVANRPRSRSNAGGHSRFPSTVSHHASNSNMNSAFANGANSSSHGRSESVGAARFAQPLSTVMGPSSNSNSNSNSQQQSDNSSGANSPEDVQTTPGRGHHRSSSSGSFSNVSPVSKMERENAAKHMASVLNRS